MWNVTDFWEIWGKQLHGRLTRRLEDNIEADLGEVFCEGDRWIVASVVLSSSTGILTCFAVCVLEEYQTVLARVW
jgi:hypothetical protein